MNNINTDTNKLNIRISTHEKYSKYDINKWIFDIIKPKENQKVLDIGCGTGKQLIPISKMIKGVIFGLDSSKESLDKIPKQDNIRLIHSTMEDMDKNIPNNIFFGLIISCFSIYYSKTPEKTIKYIKNKLSLNGMFFVCGPANNNNKELIDLHNKSSDSKFNPISFLEHKGKDILLNIFKDVKIFRFINPVTFPNINSLLDYYSSYLLFNKKSFEKFKENAKKIFDKQEYFTTNKKVIGYLLK